MGRFFTFNVVMYVDKILTGVVAPTWESFIPWHFQILYLMAGMIGESIFLCKFQKKYETKSTNKAFNWPLKGMCAVL